MIDFDKFLSWAESRWDGDVIVKGNEVKVNSIFKDDYEHKLWCNPSGGKGEFPHGVYHCWKSNEGGSLVSLVMDVDKCSFEEALHILDTGDISLLNIEKKLEDMLLQQLPVLPRVKDKIDIPEHTHLISSLPESNIYRAEAEIYLSSRHLSPTGLMVCTDGDYKNRIVIPYYDRKGNLIYFNSRYLGSSKKIPKYLGPPKEIGIGKGDVIYMPTWPENGSKVYLAEGEFEAQSICKTELNGGAFGGKSISEEQAYLLKNDQTVLCFDNDKAGE